MQPIRSRRSSLAALAAVLLASALMASWLSDVRTLVYLRRRRAAGAQGPGRGGTAHAGERDHLLLKWISFAYRVGDSSWRARRSRPTKRSESTPTCSTTSRRQGDRAGAQGAAREVLDHREPPPPSPRTGVSYRYISLKTGRYDGPQRSASYSRRTRSVPPGTNSGGHKVEALDLSDERGPQPVMAEASRCRGTARTACAIRH